VSHHIATPEAKGQNQAVKEIDIIPDVCLKILVVVGLLFNLHSLSHSTEERSNSPLTYRPLGQHMASGS